MTEQLLDGADIATVLEEVVAAALTRFWVVVAARGLEDPLPPPIAASVGVFAGQAIGELDPTPCSAVWWRPPWRRGGGRQLYVP